MLHPLWAPWLALAGLILFGVVALRPTLFAFLFPILVVSGDAYPLTGQLLIQEYDSLLLAGLAGVLWNLPLKKNEYGTFGDIAIASPWQRVGTIAVGIGAGCMFVSVLLSLWRGWSVLLPSPFADQLSVYFSQQNALRVAKGYFWGLLYFGLERGWGDFSRGEWRRWFAAGVQVAIAYVAFIVIVERLVYESLWDFHREYRATGPFFTMHIGDQHVDAFITLALPWAWAMSQGLRWKTISISIGLSLLMAIAAIYTMSRATIAAVILQVLLLGVVFAIRVQWHQERGPWLRRAMVVGAVVLALAIGIAVYRAESIRARFVTSAEDWNIRRQHWERLLWTGETSWSDRIFGRGLGTVPTELAQQKGLPIPPVRWDASNGVGEIHLQGGWPLFVEQYRWPADRREERVRFVLRSEVANLSPRDVNLYRCRKSMLHSYDQVAIDVANEARSLERKDGFHRWVIETTMPSVVHREGEGPFWGAEASGFQVAKNVSVTIEDTQASKESSDGEDRVIFPHDLGNWCSSSAPWTFTCDDHLVWRAKNGPVHVLFEQGLFGLFAWCWWLTIAIATAFLCGRNGDKGHTMYRGLALISLFGFGVVAFFGTLVDTPWIVALFGGVLSSIYARDADRDSRISGSKF